MADAIPVPRLRAAPILHDGLPQQGLSRAVTFLLRQGDPLLQGGDHGLGSRFGGGGLLDRGLFLLRGTRHGDLPHRFPDGLVRIAVGPRAAGERQGQSQHQRRDVPSH